ncbi:ferredoxin--nitrite reductase [Nitratiruptor sp. SB155-2]|uniref:ferredoxin--nitrite reductase n=1 Tax=Nitratiruptor sp. (strain SB155-2) TaxID=387092 RepID=UPI0001587075|nr:ferredoxin--nitrite reductase [Nitratiruptor sp. SB155-2]BAF70543.1 ferredoxin--nitrite reductase [Nitratiruptor sp. SB155-2]
MIEELQKIYEQRSKKINKVEKVKASMSPKEAYERLLEASQKGYDALTKEDKSVFLKYFGLFDKNELTPKQFMLRVRIPGGKLTPNQAKVLGEVAKEFGNDYIDLTTRMQVELRNIYIEDVPATFAKLESVGITTYQTGIDNLRNIVTDPLDGLAYDNFFESFPILKQMQELFLKKEEWIGSLPRKFNTSIISSITNRCNAYGHDACFVLAIKDGIYGYNVYLGGKVGKIAKSADIFLQADEVVPFYEKLINFYKTYGFRDNRNKNRLYFLIEAVGMDAFREALEKFSQKELANAGETLCKMEHFDNNQGSVQLKNGSFALHAIVPGGIFSGSDMMEASTIAQENGGEIRLSVEQNLYITNITDRSSTLSKPFFQKYKNVHSPYFNNLVACAGKNECSFGVIPNKPDAIDMADFLTQEVPLQNSKIRMYWSGCVKGCGLHEWGDIGFVGAKAKENGQIVYGVDILLGGSLAKRQGAQTILKAIPLRYAKNLIKQLMIEYKNHKKPGEHFEKYYERAFQPFSKGAIGFLMLFNTLLEKEGLEYRFSLANHKPIGKFEPLEIFDFGNEIYRNITTEKAYLEIYNFQPVGSTKPIHPKKIKPELPEAIADIVYKMVHPNPNERYQVFSELVNEITL